MLLRKFVTAHPPAGLGGLSDASWAPEWYATLKLHFK